MRRLTASLKVLVNAVAMSASVVGCMGDINETTTSGEAFGFTIGMSKEEAFYRAAELYSDDQASIADPINRDGVGPRRLIEFTDDDLPILRARDQWRFYFEGPRDSVRLRFENDALAEIHRHRQSWELP